MAQEVTGLQKNARWFELRKNNKKPTGSNIPSICGRGYNRNSREKLWQEMTSGEAVKPNAYLQAIMDQGTAKEPFARSWLSNFLGVRIIDTGSWARNGFLSSPDGIIVHSGEPKYIWSAEESLMTAEESQVTPIEIKCPSKAGVIDKLPGNERLTAYFLQAEVHRYVTMANGSYVCIFDKDDAMVYHRQKDDYLFHSIIEPFTDEFMQYIETKTCPPKYNLNDPLVQRLVRWEEDFARSENFFHTK